MPHLVGNEFVEALCVARQAAVGYHGVFHAAACAEGHLYGRGLRVGVFAYVLGVKRDGAFDVFCRFFPQFLFGLGEEGPAFHLPARRKAKDIFLYHKTLVGKPGEIVHLLRRITDGFHPAARRGKAQLRFLLIRQGAEVGVAVLDLAFQESNFTFGL